MEGEHEWQRGLKEVNIERWVSLLDFEKKKE
jgi:hypothetical protein